MKTPKNMRFVTWTPIAKRLVLQNASQWLLTNTTTDLGKILKILSDTRLTWTHQLHHVHMVLMLSPYGEWDV